MQSGQNPFDPGRTPEDGNVGQPDRTVPPPAPQPPPSYHQHFQTVRFGSTPSLFGQFGGGQPFVGQVNTIFGSHAAAASTGQPPLPPPPVTATSGLSIFGASPGAARPVFESTPAIFGGGTAGSRSIFTKPPDNFCIFPAGASNPSKFRFVASRLGPTASSNVFEKRFGGGGGPSTSLTNIFGKVEQRSSADGSQDDLKMKSFRTNPAEVEPGLEPPPVTVPYESKPDVRTGNVVKKPLLRRSGLEAKPFEPSTRSSSSRTQNALTGLGSVSRRPRLPSKDTEKLHHHHHGGESRTRRVSERSSRELLRLPQDEIGQLTSIVLKGVPMKLNNKRFLLQHFGRYGIVQKINCLVRKEMSIVHFVDHEGARKAKENGTELEPGRSPVLILWGRMATPTVKSSRSLSTAATMQPSSTKTVTRRTESQSKNRLPPATESQSPSRRREDDDDVQAELQTMSQGTNLAAASILQQRPREAVMDAPSTYLSPKNSSPKSARRSSPHPPPSSQLPDGCDSIQALANGQAVNAADRFQVLVARDKFIRQGTKKQSDLASATVAIGTCPDMCPEKERYMREDRGQLHPYEFSSGSDEKTGEFPRVDHRKAIKEYSRSSADQEEPLPHELRPPNVLARTMDYLVCNILDLLDTLQGPNAAAEWYDFVWNRTRAIRKDITQQHLCDRTSVALAEKCTRFHIHCAERLCEEDMSIFDQKINNENLTKCLQTLKHLYADLGVKGELCPNEPEFRAYDILLNLNEGDTLREVLRLRPDIRGSNEVRFALRLFANLDSNNYVAFFRNVRMAPYLMACILQRYFTQVRERALKVTLKAYCPPNHSGQFPIGKFVEMLNFEDQAEAQEFLGYHSLSVEYDYLVWDRAGLTYPESAVPTRRARLLIESKRRCSVGEIVNGGRLPANPLDIYVPHSSFDRHGKLIDFGGMQTDVSTRDGGSLQSVVTKTTETKADASGGGILESSTSTFDEQKRQLLRLNLNQAVEDEVGDITVEVSSAMIETICRTSLQELQINVAVMGVASNLLTDVTTKIIRDVAESTLREFKTVELRMRLMREEAELNRQRLVVEAAADEAFDDILDDVASREARILASTVLRKELDEQWQRDSERCSEYLSSEYENRWTSQFIVEISSNVHRDETEYRRSTLMRIAKKMDVWRAVTFSNKWRQFVARRKRTRQSMESFPSSVNLAQSRKTLMAEPWKHGLLQSPVQIASDQTYNKCLLDLGVYRKHLEIRLKETPLDLERIAANNIVQGDAAFSGTYWKVAVLLDDGTSENDFEFSDWVRLKLTRRQSSPSVPMSSSGVIVKAFDASPQNGKELQGSRGMVMVLTSPLSTSSPYLKSYWADEYRRLTRILGRMPPHPRVPVLVLCPWLTQSDIVERELRLKTLANVQRIATYRIASDIGDMKEPSATTRLITHMEWLASQCPPVPNLKSIPLEAFVDDHITKFFSSVVYRATRNGSVNGSAHLHPPPDLLVSRYNDAIRFAADVASSSKLKDVSWPPKELSKEFLELQQPCTGLLSIDWNSEQSLSRLHHLVERYRLPPFPHEIVDCTTFDRLSHVVRIYIDSAVSASETFKTKGSKAVLSARIQQIIDRASQIHDLNLSNSSPSDVVPWIDVMQAMVDHMFCCLADVNVTVVYDPGLAGMFTVRKEWDSAVDQAMAAASARLKKTKPTPDVVKNVGNDFREEQGLKRKLHQDPFAEASLEDEIHSECRRLSRQLAAERQRNAEYDGYLKSLLASDSMPFKL